MIDSPPSSDHPSLSVSTRAVGEARVHVIDGLYPPAKIAFIEQWSRLFALHFAETDTVGSEYRHLVHNFALDDVDRDPILREMRDLAVAQAERFFGRLRPELKRIHLNAAPYGTFFLPHTDLGGGCSVIYYVNAGWRPEWGGETLFFDGEEAVAAVSPKGGRMAAFAADILHTIVSPNRNFMGNRATIAFKFAPGT